jgi:hypothetical protein
MLAEADLAAECGTTEDGTNYLGTIADVVTGHMGDLHMVEYVTVDLPDPPSDEQVDTFWAHLVESVDAGFGVLMNFISPSSNPPFPIKGSGPCPSFYSYGVVYHYTSALGYSDDGGEHATWVVDSGGSPFGYWITARQCAILCGGKGYAWARLKSAPGVPILPGPAQVPTTTQRYWPVTADRFVTSPFGPRDGGFHSGVDFGFHGGSGDRPVFAIQSGTVQFSGPAQGYGGPDPAGWIVIDSDDSQGSGVFEYGHVVRLPHIGVGVTVNAGDQIATINPNEGSNGGVAPHLHLSYMPRGYDPAAKMDALPLLDGAAEPAVISAPPQHHLPEDPAAMIVNHHPQPAPAPAPAPQQQTCLTGRPHHHSENPPPDEQLLDMRAEGLCTQALVYAIAEKLGLDAAGIYQSARDSF